MGIFSARATHGTRTLRIFDTIRGPCHRNAVCATAAGDSAGNVRHSLSDAGCERCTVTSSQRRIPVAVRNTTANAHANAAADLD